MTNFDRKNVIQEIADSYVNRSLFSGIEWVAEQLSKIFKDKNIPNLLMLTKGLSIFNNDYELLVDKL